MTTFNPVIIEIRPSKLIPGEVGLFAARSIKKDETIIDASAFNEKLFPWEEYNALDPLTKKKIRDFCCGRDEGFYAPKDLNLLSIAWYMNHSCDPNIGFDKKYNFVAMKNLKRGDELFWDYSYDETNPHFRMKCGCKSKHCREKISGNDWKNADKLNFNMDYVSPHVRKLIANKK